MHGVKHSSQSPSQFLDDEYVIFDPSQYQIKYLIEFAMKDDLPKINSAFVGLNLLAPSFQVLFFALIGKGC